ncbi:MAG: hypothetical protein O6931_09810 [Gammaproteobacteria bacterium]|nr:hypothetical protein [Gammaproteobacteria bacterium]
MDSKFKNLSEDFKGRVKDTAEHAMDQAKNSTQVAANAVDSLKNPAHILNSASMKLNDLSHDYFKRLLKEQRKIVDGVVADGAKRIRVMADADNLKELWETQQALFPATRDRVVTNVKETLEILGHTRDGLKDLWQSTVLEFQGKKAPKASSKSKPRATKKKSDTKKVEENVSDQSTASKKTASSKPKKAAAPEKAA